MLRVKIDGMTCAHCVRAVTTALAKVPGVSRVRGVDLASGVAEIDGEPPIDAVVAAIKDEGYEAKPMP